MKAFMLALDSLGKPALSIGMIPPTEGIVDQYFNDSTGVGDEGETDARGPWNEGNGWKYVTAPAFRGLSDEGEADDESDEDAPRQVATKKKSAAKRPKKSR